MYIYIDRYDRVSRIRFSRYVVTSFFCSCRVHPLDTDEMLWFLKQKVTRLKQHLHQDHTLWCRTCLDLKTTVTLTEDMESVDVVGNPFSVCAPSLCRFVLKYLVPSKCILSRTVVTRESTSIHMIPSIRNDGTSSIIMIRPTVYVILMSRLDVSSAKVDIFIGGEGSARTRKTNGRNMG